MPKLVENNMMIKFMSKIYSTKNWVKKNLL